MVTPAALAVSITSSSRIEPPGCTTARTPASRRTCRPSAKGKNASDAATAPRARSLPSPPRVFARSTESLQESTRFTWPMPIPTAAPLSASRIALDLGERSARHANSRSRRVASSAASPATRVQFFGSSPSACRRSASWKSAPPEMGRYSMASRAKFSGRTSRRRFFFSRRISSASGSKPGATITSVKIPLTV